MIRPIKTPRAKKFFSSANICNRVLAICALSKDKAEANRYLSRLGYTNAFRKRVIDSRHAKFNVPTLEGVPYNHGNIEMWTFLEDGFVWNDGEWHPLPQPAQTIRITSFTGDLNVTAGSLGNYLAVIECENMFTVDWRITGGQIKGKSVTPEGHHKLTVLWNEEGTFDVTATATDVTTKSSDEHTLEVTVNPAPVVMKRKRRTEKEIENDL